MGFVIQYIRKNLQLPVKGKDRAMPLKWKQGENLHWMAFGLAFICAVIVFAPITIKNGGIFTYYGDFNVQDIPFMMHVHDMVLEGNFGWDWNTDLGSNFIGSYSFYFLFSPFFWLTLPFPTAWVPYLMAPLLVLKFSFAAFTSFFYFKRFVGDKHWAVLASLLYAFCGFSIYNVFFFHFHEMLVFFPLMLIGMEELLENDRHGIFALTVAVNAIVHYWFFIGEAVFLVLYFFVRISVKGTSHRFRKFCFVALEAVLGVGIAMVTFLPSVLAIWDNPRTGSGNLLSGWYLWLYYSEQRIPAIVASFFFPPDLPSRQNMFTGQGAQWASMAGWLPLYGMVGVLAYMRSSKGTWLRRMILVCTVCAAVPWLNALFILMNNSYYTRWFYMFEIMLALATVKALERCADEVPERVIDLKKGLIPSAVLMSIYTVAIGLTPVEEEGVWSFGLENDPARFWLTAAFAFICLGITFCLWRLRARPYFRKLSIGFTALTCVAYGVIYLLTGYSYSSSHDTIVHEATAYRGEVSLPEPDGNFTRCDFYGALDNMGLYWELPSLHCFHSVVPASIMEFYPMVDVTRDVSSKPDYEYYALRSFLSVRWLYAKDAPEQSPIQGFEYYGTEDGYTIYENTNYIPMGYTFDYYITEAEFENVPVEYRDRVLLSALVLTDTQIGYYDKQLTHLKDGPDYYMSYEDFEGYVTRRTSRASESFVGTSDGFVCRINLRWENLVFFSVPYDEGWTAYVNGVQTAIERVDYGFMAVPVPKGDAVIEFRYETPGLRAGAYISGGSLALLAAYCLFWAYLNRRNKADVAYLNELLGERSRPASADEPELPPDEDLTIVRSPEDVPPPNGPDGPEETYYPEL